MNIYLLECGEYMLFFVKERSCYYFLSDCMSQLAKFIDGDIDMEALGQPHKLCFHDQLREFTDYAAEPPIQYRLGDNLEDSDILNIFLDPSKNGAAIIAHRDTTQDHATVYYPYRLKKIFNQG